MSKSPKEKKVVQFAEPQKEPQTPAIGFSIKIKLGDSNLEGRGATVLEALRAIKKPVKITTKSVLTVSNGVKTFSRALTIPLATRLFRHGFQPIQARNLELLIK